MLSNWEKKTRYFFTSSCALGLVCKRKIYIYIYIYICISAPSQLPIVTSNVMSPFFCQGCRLCMSVDFLAWIMMFRSSMVMLSYVDAKSSALLRRSWLMDGQNSSMSKQIKLRCCLFFMDLNHPIAEAVFFHWLKLAVLMILLLILSRILLLSFPISDLVGLISRQDKYIYIYGVIQQN